ncbi:LysR family transcriptional regulator [Pseudonocardia adelaidensis]|uniref:LysR family transcriptional regulator n=1 Tax=Pseudonocardia adelaidensis TaxID=648754 RepID=UPI003CD07BDC
MTGSGRCGHRRGLSRSPYLLPTSLPGTPCPDRTVRRVDPPPRSCTRIDLGAGLGRRRRRVLRRRRFPASVAQQAGGCPCRDATTRCFASTSRLLSRPATPVSQQVRRLERELGADLLDRSSRWVRPTEAGRRFLPAAREVSAAEQRALTADRWPLPVTTAARWPC